MIIDRRRKWNTGKSLIIDGIKRDLFKSESEYNKIKYKNAIGKCSMPGCSFGYNLEVHHIIPIKKGGTDTFDNYILLCRQCHRGKKNHSKYLDKMTALYTFKFFIEQDILGTTSSPKDNSHEEFGVALAKRLGELTKQHEKKLINQSVCLGCQKNFIKKNLWSKYCKNCSEKRTL